MAKQTKYHIGVEVDKLINIIVNAISGDSFLKEPAGINFVVDPTPLTAADRKKSVK